MRKALKKDEVAAAVNHTGETRIPVMMGKWWGEGLKEIYGTELDRLEKSTLMMCVCCGIGSLETANRPYPIQSIALDIRTIQMQRHIV